MQILVIGGDFFSNNRGIEALSIGSVIFLKKKYPNSRIRFLIPNHHRPSGKEIIRIERQYKIKIILFLPINIIISYGLAKLVKFFPFFKHFLFENLFLLRIYSSSDLIFVLNYGDGFTDQYGPSQLLSIFSLMDLGFLLKKEIILLPQTIGPFKTRFGSLLANKIMKKAQKIYVREKISLQIVKYYNKNAKPEFFPDLAFLIFKDDSYFEEHFQKNIQYIGLNISSLLWGNMKNTEILYSGQDIYFRYRSLIKTLLNRILKETDSEIIFIPHVYSIFSTIFDDFEAMQQIMQEIPSKRLHLINQDLDVVKIKGIIANCDFFIGSRMHSCIGALSSGIPPICIGYSHKFRGILKEFDLEELSINIFSDISEEKMIHHIFTAYSMRDQLRIKLSNKLLEQNKLLERSLKEQYNQQIKSHEKTSIISLKKRFQNIEPVVCLDLCSGCGMCVVTCPSKAIKIVKENKNVPRIDPIKCSRCKFCLSICPSCNQISFWKNGFITNFGGIIRAFYGCATDMNIRINSSSGGIVKSLIRYCLQNRKYDGVITVLDNLDDPMEPIVKIVTNDNELDNISNSKYYPVSVCEGIKEIFEDDSDSKYLFIAKPCEIEALKLAQMKIPLLKKKIPITIGIFCFAVPDRQATKALLDSLMLKNERITKLSYRGDGWPGSFSISFGEKGSKKIPYHKAWNTYLSNRKYTSFRCATCIDSTNEFADISVGDAWGKIDITNSGYSLVFARTKNGLAFLEDAKKSGFIQLDAFDLEKIDDVQPYLQGKKNALAPFYSILDLLSFPFLKYQSLLPITQIEMSKIKKAIHYILSLRKALILLKKASSFLK